jgi:hypothetical protein
VAERRDGAATSGTVALPDPGWSVEHHIYVWTLGAYPGGQWFTIVTAGNPANGAYQFRTPGRVGAAFRVNVTAVADEPNPGNSYVMDEEVTGFTGSC